MYVIEAIDKDGRVMDTYLCHEQRQTGDTILYPPKSHFASDRVMPFCASAFPTAEEAVARMPLAAEQWGSEEYRKYEGEVVNAQVVPINSEGNPNGYVIVGTTDEDVREIVYPRYKLAFKAWMALLRKKKKHRGESPMIEWVEMKSMHGVVDKDTEDFDDDIPF